MESSLVGKATDTPACSPFRTALGELTIQVQSPRQGRPMFGPETASEVGNVGPNARKWAEGLQM